MNSKGDLWLAFTILACSFDSDAFDEQNEASIGRATNWRIYTGSQFMFGGNGRKFKKAALVHSKTALCWVLCLGLWRGPIPVVHSHSLEPEGWVDDIVLLKHVAEHHLNEIGETSTDWHFHFLMPRDLLPSSSDHWGETTDLAELGPWNTPDLRLDIRHNIAADSELRELHVANVVHWRSFLVDRELTSARLPGNGASGFLISAVLSASARAVLGVAIC